MREDEVKSIKEAHKGRRPSVEQTLARVVRQKTIRVKRWQHSGSIPTLNREVQKERRRQKQLEASTYDIQLNPQYH